MLYVSEEDLAVNREPYSMQLSELSMKYSHKLSFYLKVLDPDFCRLHKIKSNTPATFFIFDNSSGADTNYRLTSESNLLDTSRIAYFIESFFSKSLKRYIRSATLNPDDLTNTVYPIVGSTFDEIVYDSAKTVFVRFYSKYSTRGEENMKIVKDWREVAKYYNDKTRNVLICEMEITDNDVPSDVEAELGKDGGIFAFPMTEQGRKLPKIKAITKKKGYRYTGPLTFTSLLAFTAKFVSTLHRSDL